MLRTGLAGARGRRGRGALKKRAAGGGAGRSQNVEGRIFDRSQNKITPPQSRTSNQSITIHVLNGKLHQKGSQPCLASPRRSSKPRALIRGSRPGRDPRGAGARATPGGGGTGAAGTQRARRAGARAPARLGPPPVFTGKVEIQADISIPWRYAAMIAARRMTHRTRELTGSEIVSREIDQVLCS